jgi:hypothetical protein
MKDRRCSPGYTRYFLEVIYFTVDNKYFYTTRDVVDASIPLFVRM